MLDCKSRVLHLLVVVALDEQSYQGPASSALQLLAVITNKNGINQQQKMPYKKKREHSDMKGHWASELWRIEGKRTFPMSVPQGLACRETDRQTARQKLCCVF
jgi:hypothetical protein